MYSLFDVDYLKGSLENETRPTTRSWVGGRTLGDLGLRVWGQKSLTIKGCVRLCVCESHYFASPELNI